MKSIDFLPERIRQQRRRRRALKRQVYLLALCIGGLALLGYLRQGRIAHTEAQLALLTERSTNLQRQIAMRVLLEKEQGELFVKQRVDEDLGSRVNALDILGELERVVSQRLTLTKLTLEATELHQPAEPAKGGRQARPRPPGRRRDEKPAQVVRRIRMVLTGLAPTDIDVANFIGQLSASPLFEDVNMGYTRTTDYKGCKAREFQTSCFVVR